MSSEQVEHVSLTYRTVMVVATPFVRWWGRLEATGVPEVPGTGPLLIIANHDSQWDPVVIGSALVGRRQIRALAKASLWKNKVVAWVLDNMGQIPIDRGRGDLEALDAAVRKLEGGACIGIFPEGTISRGKVLRARSGGGRLAQAVPGTRIVACAVTGAVDIVRFPKRPRITVRFFEPASGQVKPGESSIAIMKRVTAEIRELAPPAIAGRSKTAAKSRQAIADAAR
ncbi:MAG TPA: lysophospholipid acyltransferase family protein [Jatrophihabitantaceae bacterium]|jgi:1-acyl-sn-glycerol-3-phosphate acyltransferase|nr:lysophospholipid acyltransferase family protein [Jatrophihabitantaceae bacterium]